MGAFLDKPETDKTTSQGQTADGCTYAMSCMQGWRIHMEDAHIVERVTDMPGVTFFAVFDGHGGKTVARASGPLIMQKIVETEEFKKANQSPQVLGDALQKGLFALDEAIKTMHPSLAAGHDRSGSTVICSFLTPTHIIVGNCGDSRAMLAGNRSVRFASQDHKPSNDIEIKRIQAAGGFVEMGRVCGNLAVSRALGDYEFKDRPDLPPNAQKVTCLADVDIIPRQDTDEFYVMACDGVWDVMSNEGMVVFVNYYLERGRQPHEIVELVLDYCLELGSKDNMSIELILLPGHVKPDHSKAKPQGERAEQEKARLDMERQELAELIKQVPGVQPMVTRDAGVPNFPGHGEDGMGDKEVDSDDSDSRPRRRPSEAGTDDSRPINHVTSNV